MAARRFLNRSQRLDQPVDIPGVVISVRTDSQPAADGAAIQLWNLALR